MKFRKKDSNDSNSLHHDYSQEFPIEKLLEFNRKSIPLLPKQKELLQSRGHLVYSNIMGE